MDCNSQYLQQPAVEQVKEHIEAKKSLAVLAFSNNEVADIYALLHDENIAVNYLLDNDGFKLSSLVEIRFLDTILKDKELNENLLWESYEKVNQRYAGSKNLSIIYKIVKGFIDDHEVYTPSLWHIYLDEISSEQLISTYNKVLVSTIHKAKGKEFDTVILVAHKMVLNDDFIRLFYVGMTRAKKKLIIVTNNEYFKSNSTPSVENIVNKNPYKEPTKKTFVMGLSDLYMSYRAQHDKNKTDLIAGSQVILQESYKYKSYVLVQNNLLIGQLSKKMQEVIKLHEAQGYEIINITIENVIEWFDEKFGDFRQLPLCKIIMNK